MSDVVACAACGASASLRMIAPDANRRTTSECFQFYRCSDCTVLFIHPQPEDLSRYYPPGYVTPPRSVAHLRRVAERSRYQIELLQRFVHRGRLLEIGPGYGSFLWLAREAGFATEAIEADEAGMQYVSQTVGTTVMKSSRPQDVIGSLPGNRYEAIVLWHSLEHLPDPWTTLREAARVLAPGGALLVATPNPEARQFAMLEERWPHLDAPRHLWLLPLRALQRYVAPFGLALAFATTDDPGGRRWNRFGWSQAILNLVPIAFQHGILARLGTRVAGWLIAASLRPWEGMPMQGAAYVAVFVKRPSNNVP